LKNANVVSESLNGFFLNHKAIILNVIEVFFMVYTISYYQSTDHI